MAEQPLLLVLHVPKTAGTTLNSLFYANSVPAGGVAERKEQRWSTQLLSYVPDGIYHLNTRIDDRLSASETTTIGQTVDALAAKAVLGHFGFGLHNAFSRRSTYVTLLRDPVDRLVSLHAHFIRWERDAFGVLSRGLSLVDFATDPVVANDQIRRISGLEPAATSSSVILRQAKANLRDHFSLVGVTERFDEFLTLLATTLGWRQLSYVPRQVSPKREGAAVSAEDRETIEQANQLDRRLYEHVGRLIDRRIAEAGDRFQDQVAAFQRDNAVFVAANARLRVDINRAPVEELCTLPGVGPAIAQRIIAYRRANGGFRSAKDLGRIAGIGPSRRWKLLDRVLP